MYSYKLSISILIIISMHSSLFADQVVLQNGIRSEGKIICADQDNIYLQVADADTIEIPQQDVKSVFFNFSDLVSLFSGKIIECKIIDQTPTELIIMTEQGAQAIKLIYLKTYFFNASDSLEIPFLLPTGDIFNNTEIKRQESRVTGKYILLGINAGVALAPSAPWYDSYEEGAEPVGFIRGLNLEYAFRPHLIIHLGYDFIDYNNINNYHLPNYIKRHFILAGLAFKYSIPFPRDSYYSAGLGIGFNSLAGRSFYPSYGNYPDSNYQSISLNDLGTKLAIKTFLQAEIAVTIRVVVRLQFSYSFAIPFELGPGLDYEYPEKISIDFSGLAFTLHLLYQIPLP